MSIQFYKYQGTGNDFILVDNRLLQFPKNNTKLVARLCDRKFGIGADGLILLENHETADFNMIYFNADGNTSSMCGNGGRCITHFANFLGIIEKETTFEAVDGLHEAKIVKDLIHLKMSDVAYISEQTTHAFLDTGSPHHVQMVDALESYNVYENGKTIRYQQYGNAGANINFVEAVGNDTFAVRTYERGVENETLSCGTGVTAVAIAMHAGGKTSSERVQLQQPGGVLYVSFTKIGTTYTNVFLIGPATQVFEGKITM